MKKLLIIISGITSIWSYAQVGINTPNPKSSLSVNGSISLGLQENTSTTYNLTIDDHYYVYNGSANGIVNLPPVKLGDLLITGRLYRIKNSSDYNLTVNPLGSGVTIRFNNEVNKDNFTIQPGDYVEIIKTANSTSNAWDVSYIAKELEDDDSSVFVYGARLTIPPLATGSTYATWNYTTSTTTETSTNSPYSTGSGKDKWVVIAKTFARYNNPNPNSSTGSNYSGTYKITRASNSSSNYVTNLQPSKVTLVYEYQGPAFENIDKVYPIMTCGNDSNFPDVFLATFESLENVLVNGTTRTRLKVIVTRLDLMGKRTSSSPSQISDWTGTFFINLLLANKF